ncbi:MAG: hypothetical protein R3F17_00295 [Planctomycetota bacterium]
MKFRRVRIASLAWHLPDAAVTSDELERRIEPLYARLGLSVGRLELMSGIRERRPWPVDVRAEHRGGGGGPAGPLEAAGVAPAEIGMVLHTSVCRDFLEPATASVVHAALGLPPEAQALDLSNACLGFVNGMVMAGALLEAGHLQAALVVSGENGGPLVEQTVAWLNQDEGIGRNELKRAFSSLTIGAGAVAAVLVRDEGETGHRLLGATARSATQHHALVRAAPRRDSRAR